MNKKLLNLVLLLSSLFGYLEWGADNSMFLFQGEYEVLIKFISEPGSVIHPFIILPMFGQVLLLVTLFQHEPNKTLTYIGIGCIGLLLGFMFVIGILSFNISIMVSTLPFLTAAILVVRTFRASRSMS